MTRRGARLAFVLATASSALASAQPRVAPPPSGTASSSPVAASGSSPTNLRAHVGTEYAGRLLRSTDPDDRIRGVQRLAGLGTPEAVAMLVQATEGSQGSRDSRMMLEMARALARFSDHERARAALSTIVSSGNPGRERPASPARTGDALQLAEGDPVARAQLAREIAAIALARSGTDGAFEQLFGVARGGGSGQGAAMRALLLYPPRNPDIFGARTATLPVAVIRMLGQLGDLRALDILHNASRSSDVATRSATLLSLAELGDARALPVARAAIADADVRLRAAAAEAFVLLGAPERTKAVVALVSDDATAALGIRLAERVGAPEITKALVARAYDHPDREVRAAAIRALGRAADPEAAKALVSPRVLGDPGLQYDGALALARSPAPNAMALVSAIAAGNLRGLGVRAYVVRALVRGERDPRTDVLVRSMLASKAPRERALAVFVRVALEDANAEGYLGDPEPRVRRAAAMGALAHPSRPVQRALVARSHTEPDPVTRQVLGIGLLDGDTDGLLTTTWLVDRAEAGGADAALAAQALACRADEPLARKVGQLLGSKDPLVRAHTARGLASARLPDATGRLASAYAYETDAEVRRAIVSALAARMSDASAPSRRATLELAAELDPDGPTRQIAGRALDGAAAQPGAPTLRDVAWLRVVGSTGAPLGAPYVGSLVRADNLAVPLVFDDDGYAIVAGLPPGESTLVLAPRLPSYDAGTP